MRTPRRRAPRGSLGVAIALAVVVAGVATGAAAPRAEALAADGACPDVDGVTVVVDFRDLGGATIVRCARGPVEDGLDALRVAAIDYDTTVRFPGMVCRIEGRPADEPCQNAPPADAYWSYWHAEHGTGWNYAQRGPSSRTPPPGSSEGWSFSTGTQAPPRTAPTTYSAPPSPTPAPSPESDPPATSEAPAAPPPPPPEEPATQPPPPPPPAPPAGSAVDEATTEPSASPTGAAPTTPAPNAAVAPSPHRSPRSTRTATPTPTPVPVQSSELLRIASADGDDSSPVGTIVGVALIVALGGAAAVTAWRRRSSP
ncbi:MAG: hypothetical protein KY469_16305 [Actinobacteria bacterium]|nr:hypothetical protein [Actinomycetota bacterium]